MLSFELPIPSVSFPGPRVSIHLKIGNVVMICRLSDPEEQHEKATGAHCNGWYEGSRSGWSGLALRNSMVEEGAGRNFVIWEGEVHKIRLLRAWGKLER